VEQVVIYTHQNKEKYDEVVGLCHAVEISPFNKMQIRRRLYEEE